MSHFQSKSIRAIMWLNIVALMTLVLLQALKNTSQETADIQSQQSITDLAYIKVGRVESNTPYLELNQQSLKNIFQKEVVFNLTSYSQKECVQALEFFKIKQVGEEFYLVGAGFDTPQGVFLTAALELRNLRGNLLVKRDAVARVKSDVVYNACHNDFSADEFHNTDWLKENETFASQVSFKK